MSKLNKQEVNAIASKLHQELTKIAEAEREEAIKSYVPSTKYSTVKSLLEDIRSRSNMINELRRQYEEIRDNLYNIVGQYIYDLDKGLSLLDDIIKEECKLKDIPSIEELKNDIIISAIDDCFDAAAFIEEQVNKFKS